jgi:hypothetical protein
MINVNNMCPYYELPSVFFPSPEAACLLTIALILFLTSVSTPLRANGHIATTVDGIYADVFAAGKHKSVVSSLS